MINILFYHFIIMRNMQYFSTMWADENQTFAITLPTVYLTFIPKCIFACCSFTVMSSNPWGLFSLQNLIFNVSYFMTQTTLYLVTNSFWATGMSPRKRWKTSTASISRLMAPMMYGCCQYWIRCWTGIWTAMTSAPPRAVTPI